MYLFTQWLLFLLFKAWLDVCNFSEFKSAHSHNYLLIHLFGKIATSLSVFIKKIIFKVVFLLITYLLRQKFLSNIKPAEHKI